MSTLVLACTKGKIGNTEYYSVQMDTYQIMNSTTLAKETDGWLTLGVQERYQREISETRVKKAIAPYFAYDDDRFVGSFVVALNDYEIFEFQSVADITGVKVDESITATATQKELEKIGILTISGGRLVIIDGQHRSEGLRLAFNAKFHNHEITRSWGRDNEEMGDFENDLFNVLILKAGAPGEEGNFDTVRKIFNNLNKHAKKTAKKDDIITSMDDGCAFVTRNLVTGGQVLGDLFEKQEKDGRLQPCGMVNWQQNTLSSRSVEFTSMSGLYNLNALILKGEIKKGNLGVKEKDFINSTKKPDDDIILQATNLCKEWWTEILDGVDAYKQMLKQKRVNSEWRDPKAVHSMSKWNMLFQPQGQYVMVKGIVDAVVTGHISRSDAISKVNDIDWSLKGNSHWWDKVYFASSGTLLRQSTNKDLAAFLVTYELIGDKVGRKERDKAFANIRDLKKSVGEGVWSF